MRLQRFKKSRTKSTKRSYFGMSALVLAVLILTISIFRVLTHKNYTKNIGRLSVAVNDSDSTKVLVFDTQKNEITVVSIPNSTEVESAGGYGILKLGNVWKLSKSEKNKENLVSETLTKYFYLPTDVSSEPTLLNLISGNLPSKFSILFKKLPRLTFADRLTLFSFSFRVASSDIKSFDLVKLKYLSEKTLKDGSSGYIKISDALPPIVSYYFYDLNFEQNNPKVKIINNSKSTEITSHVKNIVEALGGHVLYIEKNGTEEITDCKIDYHPKFTLEAMKLSKLINCMEIQENSNLQFDMEIQFGEDFAKGF